MCDRVFKEGQIVKHYKWENNNATDKKNNKYLYRIIGEAIHTETEEKLIIYQALYEPYTIWARPYDMFMSEVDHVKNPNVKQKFRFECYDLEASN